MILDISLNGPDGLELLKNIRASDPDLPVLVLSMHDEAIYAERALRARANGYIMKQEATEKVLVAVRRILNGEVYLSDRMSNKMLQQYIGGAPSMIQSRIASLSDRELEVFRLIGEGRATREIAEELHLSIKTVETYQAHIKEKLALRSGRELIQHAIQWKINEKSVTLPHSSGYLHVINSPAQQICTIKRAVPPAHVAIQIPVSGNPLPLHRKKYEERIGLVPLATLFAVCFDSEGLMKAASPVFRIAGAGHRRSAHCRAEIERQTLNSNGSERSAPTEKFAAAKCRRERFRQFRSHAPLLPF